MVHKTLPKVVPSLHCPSLTSSTALDVYQPMGTTSCLTDMPPALFSTCTALFSLGRLLRMISVSRLPSSAAWPPLTHRPDSGSALHFRRESHPLGAGTPTEPSIFYALLTTASFSLRSAEILEGSARILLFEVSTSNNMPGILSIYIC